MSGWLDNTNKPSSNIQKLLQKRTEKANPRRELTNEEAKRLAKLETIADKLKRGENVWESLLSSPPSNFTPYKYIYKFPAPMPGKSIQKQRLDT